MIILEYFFLFFYKNICQGTSNEYPQYVFMENWRNLFQKCHQILLLNKSSVTVRDHSLPPIHTENKI